MSPRLIAYGLAALAVAGLYWRYVYVTNALAESRAEASQLHAELNAERANVRKANEASKAYQSDLARVERERADVPVVRLCRKAPSLPASRAAQRSNDAPTGHVSEAVEGDPIAGPDIGAQLLDYGIACEANALQLDRLQQWVRGR